MKFKTWIEISRKAIERNAKTIRRLLAPKTKLWAVVKSNAYGHGLLTFSEVAAPLVDGFCVDSVVEGLKLRKNGVKKPILVLGPTLPLNSLKEAYKNDIALTISNPDALARLLKEKRPPKFHLKIDTGMHRQGFYVPELKKVIAHIKRRFGNWKLEIGNLPLAGVYTHFASAKDLNYPTFTDFQFHTFKKAVRVLERAGFKNLVKHAAATGAALINKEYHLDAVRCGAGLYGLWPSKELELQLGNRIKLEPALSWKSIVSEIKEIEKGGYIGYDLVERVYKPTTMAIIPIGYWHGFDRGLSGIGEVLIAGKHCRVLGRVSMDLIAVDAGDRPCRMGATAVIIGAQKNETLTAAEMAAKINTSSYEIVTRVNPLIERVITE